MGIEDKYEEVRQLIILGRERGYLLYDEINDVLPEEVHSPEDLDDMFLLFDSLGIEMVDRKQIREIVPCLHMPEDARYPVLAGLAPDERRGDGARQAWLLEIVAGIQEAGLGAAEVAKQELSV